MKSEAVQRYRRQAEECELNAERTTNGADRDAWNRLAEDWTKLALGPNRPFSEPDEGPSRIDHDIVARAVPQPKGLK
jgi:hypothetical protein